MSGYTWFIVVSGALVLLLFLAVLARLLAGPIADALRASREVHLRVPIPEDVRTTEDKETQEGRGRRRPGRARGGGGGGSAGGADPLIWCAFGASLLIVVVVFFMVNLNACHAVLGWCPEDSTAAEKNKTYGLFGTVIGFWGGMLGGRASRR